LQGGKSGKRQARGISSPGPVQNVNKKRGRKRKAKGLGGGGGQTGLYGGGGKRDWSMNSNVEERVDSREVKGETEGV